MVTWMGPLVTSGRTRFLQFSSTRIARLDRVGRMTAGDAAEISDRDVPKAGCLNPRQIPSAFIRGFDRILSRLQGEVGDCDLLASAL